VQLAPVLAEEILRTLEERSSRNVDQFDSRLERLETGLSGLELSQEESLRRLARSISDGMEGMEASVLQVTPLLSPFPPYFSRPYVSKETLPLSNGMATRIFAACTRLSVNTHTLSCLSLRVSSPSYAHYRIALKWYGWKRAGRKAL
jgi:hypothetical protein